MNLRRITPFKKGAIIIGLLLCTFCTAFALSSDQYQTLHVTANAATYDRTQRTITYEGNVQADQGSAHLDGDKVIVYKSEDDKIKQMVAYGRPAHYNTLPSAHKGRLYVEALKITYDPNAKTVLLEKNGKVKQNGDSFSGPYIWYDMVNGIVRSKTTQGKDRTEMIIEPQQQPIQKNK